MDDVAQQFGGGRPRMMSNSTTDHTVTSSFWSYTYLVEKEYHMDMNEQKRTITDSSTDHTVTSSSWSYTALV